MAIVRRRKTFIVDIAEEEHLDDVDVRECYRQVANFIHNRINRDARDGESSDSGDGWEFRVRWTTDFIAPWSAADLDTALSPLRLKRATDRFLRDGRPGAMPRRARDWAEGAPWSDHDLETLIWPLWWDRTWAAGRDQAFWWERVRPSSAEHSATLIKGDDAVVDMINDLRNEGDDVE